MYTALNGGVIGVHAGNLENALALASQYGFTGLDFSAAEVATLSEQHGAEYVKDLFAQANVRPAGWGLPTEWRGTEAKWREELHELPRLARAAAQIGGTRTMTWIMPCSNDRDWEENLAFHIERFLPISRVLAHEGVHLGLEFIGPKTLRESQKFPFVHTMSQMLGMVQQIGDNVGLLLDCWHWYTSHGTLAELHNLTPEQVVYVHVNDAPSGIPIDEQLDHTRALPGATGVIDIAGFLKALQSIGYDGPVVAEPFSPELKALPSDAARLEAVAASMTKIFRDASL